MATYQFSALADGQQLTFNATADRLNFDQSVIAAGDLRVTAIGSNVLVTYVTTGYDADGGGAQLIATLTTIPTVTAADIAVI